MKNEKQFLLRDVKTLNRCAMIAGGGFLLYLLISALGWKLLADAVSILFGLFALYLCICVLAGRQKDKEAYSYSLLWGTGALAILMLGGAYLTIKAQYFG